MDDWQVLAIVAAWIIGIVILIVRFKVNPIIALVVGALGMGLSLGLGVEGTTEAVMTGFGEVMLEIGLLIGWGVIMGSMLYQMGAIQRLVAVIIKLFGRKTPYGLGLAMGVALQSIHIDVLLVMTAPLAKAIGKRMGRNGVGKIAVAMAIGLECGIVLMVPGVATVALSGLMGVPLGQMLIFGTIVLIPTLLISIFLMCWLFDHGFWNPAKDESQAGAEEPEGMAMMAPDSGQDAAALELLGTDAFAAETGQTATVVRTETAVEPQHAEAAASAARSVKQTPLLVMFAPLIGSLLLVALGAGMKLADLEHPVVTFFASPVVALLVGVIFTSIVCARTLGAATSGKALEEGLRQAGNIMLLNGAGGCLGAVVATGGLGALLSGYFSTNSCFPWSRCG